MSASAPPQLPRVESFLCQVPSGLPSGQKRRHGARALLQLSEVCMWANGVFALDTLGQGGRKPQVETNVCRTRDSHLLKATSLAPSYPSLISLACFLRGHWTSEQESTVFAVWLWKADEVVLQYMCLPAAPCHTL